MLSFQNLHVVRVSKCWSLKNLFPASIDRNLLQLEELDLSNCGVREIVAEEGGETSATGFIFPRVTYLKLWELPKLRTLYQGIHTSECPMLMKLMVYHCDHVKICQLDIGAQESLFLVEKGQFPEDLFHKLKILHMMNDKSAVFPLGLLQRFHNLQNLVLSISSYKEIFSYEEVQKHAGTLSQIKDLMLCVLLDLNQMWKRNPKMDMILQNLEILNIVAEEGGETSATGFIFPRVTYLKLWELPKLRTLYQGIHTSECPMLMKLMVYHCDHVKICQLDIGAQESLFLVEKGQFPEDLFHKLKILHMMNDKSAVFPLGLLQRFHNLQNLVLSISSYKEIFSYEEVQKHAGTLSQIKDLMLCVLLDLNQMWKRNPKMDMILQNLEILNIVAEEGGETSATGFIFPRVTYLKLWELPKLRTLYQGIHTSECPMLMKLMVYHCDHVKICQLDIGAQESLFLVEKVILNLKILTMSIKDMSMTLQGQFPEDLFHKLKILHMMNDKSDMWKRNPEMDMILQNLEILNVLYCHNLINLVPFSTYFRNLTTLDVCNCDGLINLVTYSTVKSMVQLIKISIQECKMMIEVVANEGDVTTDDIIFNKLKRLLLSCLSNLTSFCSGNYSFKFPSLDKIDVRTCPNMKIFSP
ncbi:hypothetical protein EZV62_006987 [Acer yangbiense]|uniref:Disease resistance protein At4g27190-like leucine-rich repeats domain-containing protein n=1 Tax=Acer yangbiense TaxID=1000413 RepID=A0A5C7IAJ8_9ROSI|nr:hypothetical protein EZV62_006987 [Acer yangbiense]